MSGTKQLEQLLPGNNLFAKSGITVLSALAGVGKTTYLVKQIVPQLKKNGYEVVYFNADYSPTYDEEMFEPISSAKLIELTKEADEKDVIIIDSIKAYTAQEGLDVMLNPDMYRFMLGIRSISISTKCTFILVHHSFKEKKLKTPEEHFYGSRAIEEQCDSGFIFQGKTATIIKNRLGLPRGHIEQIQENMSIID